jgi:hypothetical protein
MPQKLLQKQGSMHEMIFDKRIVQNLDTTWERFKVILAIASMALIIDVGVVIVLTFIH